MSAQRSPGEQEPYRPGEDRRERITTGYVELWRQLDQSLDEAIAAIPDRPRDRQAVLQAFDSLERLAASSPVPGLTLLLFDPDRRAVAWAGKGLLHDVDVARMPDRGRHHLASFSAVTLLVTDTLFGPTDRWHIVAGRSLRVDEPPFASGFVGRTARWTVISRTAPVDSRHLRIDLPDSPTLVVDFSAPLPAGGKRRHDGGRWWLVFLSLVLVGLSGSRSWAWILLPVGLGAAGLGVQAPAWAIAMVLVGAVAAAWAWRRGPLISTAAGAIGSGALVSCLALALALRLQAELGSIDLGSSLLGSPWIWFVRLAGCLLVFGVLSLIGASSSQVPRRASAVDLLSVATLVLALIAAASFEQPLWCAGLVVLSGALIGRWCLACERPRRPSQIAFLVLITALLSGTSWELGYHRARKQQMAEDLLPAMAPPTEEEFDRIVDQVEDYLTRIDLSDFSPARITDLQRQDLAFEIWHESPLAVSGALSALVVELPDSPPSSFSFGLLLTDDDFVDFSPLRWGLGRLPVWKDAVFHGVTDLTLVGQPWARVRFWLALAPGFRLTTDREEDLTAELLRVGPGRSEPRLPNLQDVQYVLYDPSGHPLQSPWRQSPRLSETLLDGGSARVRAEGRRYEVVTAVGADGVRALFLPCPSWADALERVGTQALTSIAVMLVLVLLVQIPTMRPPGLARICTQVWRSYSSRLVLVYSILVLLPMLLTTLVVVRGQEERLRREQQLSGETALESAQRILAEYVWELEPGFGIDSALNNELLTWLAGVVHHDVNLYWRSRVSSSSKSELFKAGLLPERIPGEIFSRLTLMSDDIATRTNRAGRAEYLEIYAPLTIPGVSRDSSRLFLSLPMLAQQEETAAQIASLRSGAMLGTATVMMILLAIGTRLARRFTEPLTEIVRGTQRIAAGERSLDLRPSELELATLAEAIDVMAERIAEGRQKLLQEKRVVERMVENIAAGVVSLDTAGKALMANRVAIEMLGVEVGGSITEVVAAKASLAPVLAFLQRRPDVGPLAETIQLEDAEGEQRDWSLVWVPLPGQGEPSALLVVEEVTEVLRGQRLEAWAEMARMIAHEIKNPLTPIRLSTEHMQQVYAEDPESFKVVFESCTSNILRQVDELQEIASDFSTYSRIPKIELSEGDLSTAVGEICEAYRSAPPAGIELTYRSDPDCPAVEFDAKLLGRAIRNIIENAIRATRSGGRIDVEVSAEADRVEIVIADSGPGVGADVLSRIFDPYFSTHASGTGLGLPIARQIVEEHGGTISARNRPASGLEVLICLPAGESSVSDDVSSPVR